MITEKEALEKAIELYEAIKRELENDPESKRRFVSIRVDTAIKFGYWRFENNCPLCQRAWLISPSPDEIDDDEDGFYYCHNCPVERWQYDYHCQDEQYGEFLAAATAKDRPTCLKNVEAMLALFRESLQLILDEEEDR